MSQEIGVAGHGPRVEKLVELLKRADRPVVVWSGGGGGSPGLLSQGVEVLESAQALSERCRLVFVAAPASEMRVVASALGECVVGYHRLVHTTLHLEPETGLRGSEILAQETATRQIGALVGPTDSLEQLGGKPGGAVVGSRFPAVISDVQGVLSSAMFRVYGNSDLVGVEMAGAMASLLSIAVGVGDALGLGGGVRGTLCARGVAEMGRLGSAFGAQERTFAGMSGLGQLISLISEEDKPTMKIGRSLAQGVSGEALFEAHGVLARDLAVSSRLLVARALEEGVSLNIFAQVDRMLANECTVAEAMQALLSLQQMME